MTFTAADQFRIPFTGIIREIRLWVTDKLPDDSVSYGFRIGDTDIFGNPNQWFTPTENDTEYSKTGLNIAVVKGQPAIFYEAFSNRPHKTRAIFVFETQAAIL